MTVVNTQNGNIIIKTVEEYMVEDGLTAELAYIARKVDLETWRFEMNLTPKFSDRVYTAMQERLGW